MARRLQLIFAALLTVLALAPGPAAADAQNRAGAFLPAAPTRAPTTGAESSCTRPGSQPGSARITAGCCVATKTGPPVKPGTSGGPTAGQRFPQSMRDEALEENPSTCVFCRMETDRPQVDHSIPRSRGGDATIDNAQTACPHCNASKRDRDFPVNPPPGYRGRWPPSWWGR